METLIILPFSLRYGHTKRFHQKKKAITLLGRRSGYFAMLHSNAPLSITSTCEAGPKSAARFIAAQRPDFTPRIGLVLGSGLGPLADALNTPLKLSYREIPGFPEPSVEGHAGRLVLGYLGEVPVACLQGRVHVYEGADGQTMKTMIRSLQLLGCHTLILTNAAGSLKPEMPAGSLMMITDHINFLGFNPLAGPNDAQFGPRFFDMSEAYDRAWQGRLRNAARDRGIQLFEGIYLAVTGPNFETPAEIRAFRSWGADAVGMSTVPEVLIARHAGMKVAAISAITNLASGLEAGAIDHQGTLTHAQDAATRLQPLILSALQQA